MSETDFENEMNYQVTMSYVRKLRNNGIITDEEYHRIDSIMLEKYIPILGTLLSGKRLHDCQMT